MSNIMYNEKSFHFRWKDFLFRFSPLVEFGVPGFVSYIIN